MNASDLKPFALLDDLSDEERELLCEELEPDELAAGRALFEEGAEADGMVLLLEGELVLESRGVGPLGRLGPGSVLGALSLVASGRREVTALAAEACALAWLSRSGFRRLVEDSPRVACKLQEAIVHELARNLREGLPGLRETLPSAPNDGPE